MPGRNLAQTTREAFRDARQPPYDQRRWLRPRVEPLVSSPNVVG